MKVNRNAMRAAALVTVVGVLSACVTPQQRISRREDDLADEQQMTAQMYSDPAWQWGP